MFGPVEQSKLFPVFYKMPTGPGHYFGRLAVGRLYGQKFLIAFLMELSKQWGAKHREHRFGIGDIAAEDGSPLPDHVSHTTGAAVDLFIIHKEGVQRNDKANMITYDQTDVYDFTRTTELAQMIAIKAQQFRLQQYLYNDPKVQKAVQSSPPIQTFVKHDEHIHLLFNGKHPHTEEDLDRILGLKSLTERVQDLLQQLVSSLQMLALGSQGADVHALQVVLNALGASQFPSLVADGIFGSKTRSRVQEFQGKRGLAADGIVGPKTKNALKTAAQKV